MALHRSKRTPVLKIIQKEKSAPSIASDSKIIKNTTRIIKKTALKLIVISSLFNILEINKKELFKLFIYELLLNL
jgi:hypothetical protein